MVVDAASGLSKQSLKRLAKALTLDEAGRIATNIAKMPNATRKGLVEKLHLSAGAAITKCALIQLGSDSWHHCLLVVWVVAGAVLSLSFEPGRITIGGIAGGPILSFASNRLGAKKGGVEGCNKELRQALAIAHWSSWAKPWHLSRLVFDVGFGLGPENAGIQASIRAAASDERDETREEGK